MKTAAASIEPLETRIAPAAVGTLSVSTLNGVNGFKLQGEGRIAHAGGSVSAAGDINGDGFADLLISGGGDAYVVFGKAGGFTTPFDLATLAGPTPFDPSPPVGTNGFIISVGLGDAASSSVRALSAAGDVNGDGLADMIFGTDSGASYVVFGKAGSFPPLVVLSDLNGTNGFEIDGEAAGDFAGSSVSGAGDVNHDGFDDVIIGASGAGPNGANSGASYVVFGKATGFTTPLKLSSLNGTNGFKIQGEAAGDDSGESVSGAGDVNGDGFADVLVGAAGASDHGVRAGAGYLVFGKAGGFAKTLNLSTLNGANGVKLVGEAAGDAAGWSVGAAGDVNGDGVADLVIGALGADPNGDRSGAAYVVFGKTGGWTTPVHLATLNGTTGFKIQGETVGGQFGRSVEGAGDVNGDGFDDLILGALSQNPQEQNAGASYVIFGHVGGFGTPLNVSALDAATGFKLQGEVAGGRFSRTGDGAGDVNGDGFDDLITGAYDASPHGAFSGAAYVIFGARNLGYLSISKSGTTASFKDADGDLVTVHTSKGVFTSTDFTLSATSAGSQLELLDLHGQAAFQGANLSFTALKAKGGTGDGLVNVGIIDATGIDLGVVSVSGDLGKIVAGDAELKTPGLATLGVGSLGVHPQNEPAGSGDPLHSIITGALGVFTAKHNVDGFLDVTGGTKTGLGTVNIGGDLDGRAGGQFAGLIKGGVGVGAVTVRGSVIGGAGVSGILSLGKLGRVSIGGALTSADPAQPVVIRALGKTHPTTAADAIAITGISIAHDVLHARILAGYGIGNLAANPDAGIGAISVGGNWTASSVAAGVADSTADGFGRNDSLIAGDTTPMLLARIASITIKGTALGSVTPTSDFFGLTAQKIGALKIGGVKKLLTASADDLPLDPTNSDFHAVDFA